MDQTATPRPSQELLNTDVVPVNAVEISMANIPTGSTLLPLLLILLALFLLPRSSRHLRR